MNFLQRAGASVKAFQMRFGKATYQSWAWTQTYAERWRTYKVGQGLQSSVVVAPLAWLQRNAPDAPLRVRQKDSDGDLNEIDPSTAGPGALLSLWDNPNEYYDGRVMMKALIADYKTTGEAFVLKLRNGSGRWVEAWWAPSFAMRPMFPEDGSRYLDYWLYNIDGNPQRVDPEDVIHFRDGIDPKNSRRGFCAFAALVREVFTDEEAGTFTASLLSNLGVPGVVIAPAQGTVGSGPGARGPILDPDRVKAVFKQTFGGENRGDAMVLTAPTDIKVLSFNPQQMTLRDLRKVPEERVSGVFGVPAIVASFGAGLDRSTFANYAEAREAGYEEGIIPMQNDFAATLKKQALSEFVNDVTSFKVDFDISEVRVLQEDQNHLWTRALEALKGGGITRARFKEIVGEEPDETLDDVYYIPISLTVTPESEDQTHVATPPVRETINVAETQPVDALPPGQTGGTPPAGTNPLTLPKATTPPSGGNGNGGGTRVPVASR